METSPDTQMPVGSKWTLVLPPALAYGNQELNQYIGPQSTLVFQVELIAILDE
ncbi:FKBP-type peptidyl-prolyl cis-trans isomerase [Weeksella virosa]|uniref:FKBP-type peptidyl-prolyl cis-trans isomerase n=1 Tax=Weeksella virosa TaxID=1014 RepID=UPI000E005B94|nr:FKBP-type peptidyl-prolyl cis-trans isomerase [Weeksella virosa]MDK7675184.1 FKBP-type peptidyl-prolyl cis-trans isomerase [Weeksella virosa]SUP55127.1 FKBP-type 22 kDa peptidyl-prolyl cis-trans isomerase [Weeksella virosa]